MDNTNKKDDKSTWVIGGTLLMGMGVGVLYVRENPLVFVASLFIGLGLGLTITSIISSIKK